MFSFPSLSLKAWVMAITFLVIAIGGYFTYRHITLQAESITSLRLSEERLKVSLNSAVGTANNNATLYLDNKAKYENTLASLKQLQSSISDIEKDGRQQEEHINVKINSLDKESFEYKCYSMDVNLK